MDTAEDSFFRPVPVTGGFAKTKKVLVLLRVGRDLVYLGSVEVTDHPVDRDFVFPGVIYIGFKCRLDALAFIEGLGEYRIHFDFFAGIEKLDHLLCRSGNTVLFEDFSQRQSKLATRNRE